MTQPNIYNIDIEEQLEPVWILLQLRGIDVEEPMPVIDNLLHVVIEIEGDPVICAQIIRKTLL